MYANSGELPTEIGLINEQNWRDDLGGPGECSVVRYDDLLNTNDRVDGQCLDFIYTYSKVNVNLKIFNLN